MLLRAIALSLALIIGVGTLIPLATEYTEAGPRKSKKYKKKKSKKIRKYSKQWWKLYRLRQKRKKEMLARKRALRLRQIRLAKKRRASTTPKQVAKAEPVVKKVQEDTAPAVLPTGEAAPKTWKKSESTQAELQFRVNDDNGSPIGSAAISVVGPAVGEDVATARVKTVGGVPTASLRRNVIDRMIKENGWVVNDFQKEIGGKKVYVVVAQSEVPGGRVASRVFYFTEVDGRIYSVATNAPTDSSERLAEESEKVINSLVRRTTPQQAMNK